MTHGVVQSDVDFAARLLAADCQNREVILALCGRGLEERDAARLVEDLRRDQVVRRPFPAASRAVWPHNPEADAALVDEPRPILIPRRRSRQGKTERDGVVSRRAVLAVILGFSFLEYFVYRCIVDTGDYLARDHDKVPFVKTDDFEKRSNALTNGAGR